jgi:hypothetical protein
MRHDRISGVYTRHNLFRRAYDGDTDPDLNAQWNPETCFPCFNETEILDRQIKLCVRYENLTLI